jgi:hypothetical protein
MGSASSALHVCLVRLFSRNFSRKRSSCFGIPTVIKLTKMIGYKATHRYSAAASQQCKVVRQVPRVSQIASQPHRPMARHVPQLIKNRSPVSLPPLLPSLAVSCHMSASEFPQPVLPLKAFALLLFSLVLTVSSVWSFRQATSLKCPQNRLKSPTCHRRSYFYFVGPSLEPFSFVISASVEYPNHEDAPVRFWLFPSNQSFQRRIWLESC